MPSESIAFWRRPEGAAAIVNALAVLLMPIGLVVAALLSPEPGNTVTARVSSNVQYAVRTLFQLQLVMLPFVPLAMVSGWRTWVHAVRFREGRGTGWRGVLEAAGLGFVLALAVLSGGILTHPAEALPYIVVYGGAATALGLAIGLALRLSALLVLKRRPQA